MFDASQGRGIGTGGIGSEETISGKWVQELLQVIEEAHERTVGKEAKLVDLDIKDCRDMRPSILEGKSLKSESATSVRSQKAYSVLMINRNPQISRP